MLFISLKREPSAGRTESVTLAPEKTCCVFISLISQCSKVHTKKVTAQLSFNLYDSLRKKKNAQMS